MADNDKLFNENKELRKDLRLIHTSLCKIDDKKFRCWGVKLKNFEPYRKIKRVIRRDEK